MFKNNNQEKKTNHCALFMQTNTMLIIYCYCINVNTSETIVKHENALNYKYFKII